MNGEAAPEVPLLRLALPALLLVLAFNFCLLFQIHAVWINASNLRQQNRDLLQQIDQIPKADIDTARTKQSLLERLANEILFLAESDADLQRLVQKYQITRKSSPEQPHPPR